MTTLNRLPEPAPPPPAPDLPSERNRHGPGTGAATPDAPAAEIVPLLVESPAWPRVFPSL